jgi:hypothetical protein
MQPKTNLRTWWRNALALNPELVPMAVSLGFAGVLVGYYTIRKYEHDPDLRLRRPKVFPTQLSHNELEK